MNRIIYFVVVVLLMLISSLVLATSIRDNKVSTPKVVCFLIVNFVLIELLNGITLY